VGNTHEFIVLIALITVCSALCDAWVLRKPRIGWWEWHVPNWVRLYALPVWVVVTSGMYHMYWLWIPLALALWVLWKWTYKNGGGL